jgi:hypothetical protein
MLHLFTETKVIGSAGRRQKMWFILSVVTFPFLYFNSYEIFLYWLFCFSVYLFLCIQEQQRAPSPPISLIRGNGDVAATPISRGDVPISDASQQAHDIGTQVLSHASSIFFFKLWQTLMSEIFYLTCVYLNYIHGSKSSTMIVTYSLSVIYRAPQTRVQL